jgi:hypothetical protein
MPRNDPEAAPMKIAAAEMVNEIRAPAITRLNMSWPFRLPRTGGSTRVAELRRLREGSRVVGSDVRSEDPEEHEERQHQEAEDPERLLAGDPPQPPDAARPPGEAHPIIGERD